VNPRYSPEILISLSSLEDLAIVFDIDFTRVDAFRIAALRGRNGVLLFFVGHTDGTI
jgi:hypothetical protein